MSTHTHMVATSPEEIQTAIAALGAGSGPIAIDTERASSYRYSDRAFLLQFHRAGSGIVMIDPETHPGALTGLAEILSEDEWILHAASQDLPCLRELGLFPPRLFDTELAARLLGWERVSLATVVERTLGTTLKKGHGAADWSLRPLPAAWVEYAALDVAYLLDVRDHLAEALHRAGKSAWAEQDFAALCAAGDPPPRADPWRRTSGIHRISRRRTLAFVRALWEERDRQARAADLSPHRVLHDSLLVRLADEAPQTVAEVSQLLATGGSGGAAAVSNAGGWLAALNTARALPGAALPPLHLPPNSHPPHGRWPKTHPVRAERLARCRTQLAELSARVEVPVENLLKPAIVRELCWRLPEDPGVTPTQITDFLTAAGARSWQCELCGPVLATALHAPVIDPDRSSGPPLVTGQ